MTSLYPVRCGLLIVAFVFFGGCHRHDAAHAGVDASTTVSDGIDVPRAEYAKDPLTAGIAPRVAVRGSTILIDDTVVDTIESTVTMGHVLRIDGLFAALKTKREAWKSSHPGKNFPGVAVFRFDQTLSMLVVKSIVNTVFLAGYPTTYFAVHVVGRTGDHEGWLDVDASVPSSFGEIEEGPGKALHVTLGADKLALRWKDGASFMSTIDLPRDSQGLADHIASEWKLLGEHHDVSDRRRDNAIVHTTNDAPLKDFVAIVDAINATRRQIAAETSTKTEMVPAFRVSLAIY